MFDIVRLKADASVARVGVAVALTPARRVALVFPTGASVAIAQPATLGLLATRAQAAHKHITIVGGDADLRACAVTAGLAAAPTLDEWRAAAARDRSSTPAPALSARVRGSAASSGRLRLVEAPDGWNDGRDDHTSDEDLMDLPMDIDPPDYVARLMAAEDAPRGRADGVLPLTPSFSRPRELRAPDDVAAFAAAIRASERDEEEISDTIVETSGRGYDADLAH